ncbi:ribose 1,5-bisphosphokinase [Rhodobacter viridis]|uniref:Ribose 1,5-bisphosphate phosphokinase PhnN n=1 Tax=Rhodobacter viridis TaxID=1054202 RepID=A0A318U2F6_9RHOB|nr:phosphonate metabolism protein/1,5-bisphosphokinase (PRPP-forming) PhnN [Rhodobacter viridis]PYF12762.1 ribose 1,5-bisphosphokinase [Rhodobacter viridis]
MTGRLIAIVGPSGAGKDTLIAGLIAARPEIHRARRAITRPAAPSEDFETLSPAEFAALRGGGGFAMSWLAHDLGYGIRHAELAPLAQGRDVIFNGSRAALPDCLAVFPQLQVIEIVVSPAKLQARLAGRGREDAAEIAARLARAEMVLPPGLGAVRIVNDGARAAGIAALIAALQPESA